MASNLVSGILEQRKRGRLAPQWLATKWVEKKANGLAHRSARLLTHDGEETVKHGVDLLRHFELAEMA